MHKIAFPLNPGMHGTAVTELQDALQLCLDRDILPMGDTNARGRRKWSTELKGERSRQAYGQATAKLVSLFREGRHWPTSDEVDEPTANALNTLLREWGLFEEGAYVVAGRVRGSQLASFDGLEAVVVDVSVGGTVDLERARLSRDGAFEIALRTTCNGDDLPDLAVEIRDGAKVLATSPVRIDAAPGRVVIDVDMPRDARGGRSEFEALSERLKAAGAASVAAVDVTVRPQDLAYLARKTQWDARAIAMLIVAQRLSARPDCAGHLEPEYFYALFRSGVPAQLEAVLRLTPATARATWQAAADGGVIPPMDKQQLTKAEAALEALILSEGLTLSHSPGASNLRELLAVSIGADTAAETQLVKLLAKLGDDAPAFWSAVEDSFGSDACRRLQVDSELAALTLHNAPLMRVLRGRTVPDDSTSLEPLAAVGLAQPGAWESLLDGVPVPGRITGDSDADRRARYAEVLASQVRRAFPVAALARRVEMGAARVRPEAKDKVVAFLQVGSGKYRLGEEPLVQYLARTGTKLGAEEHHEIRRLERAYQLTPSDKAMDGLLQAGLDSAYRIAQLDESRFVAENGKAVGGAGVAAAIYAKAREIHTATVNVVLAYQTSQAGLRIGNDNASMVQPQVERQAVKQANAAVAATLETLFGELDFCACEHCRSVLSPAAYLVDLLALCDPEDEPPAGKRRPMQELRRRRPDIEHLPLTCANTSTLLPVIDMVNEALEYFVVAAPAERPAKPSMSLDGFKGYSTSTDVSAQDLLTEPQNVRAAAYAGLQGARFPLALPFNEPLEAQRRYLGAFDRTLASVMEAMRVNEDLERGGAVPFGWRDILMEELELSRGQHAILTDRTLTVRQIYGSPAAGAAEPAVPVELRNAKQFTRRLGISYEELTALLHTRFINPNIWVLPLAERLGVTLARIGQFAATADTPANNDAFEASVSAGLDLTLYGGSVAAWTRLHAATILGLLTLHDPSPQPDPCNFDAMEFRYGDHTANGGTVRELEFVRLIRFVRLWKALVWPATPGAGPDDSGARGWTIAETDAALTALWPVDQLPLSGNDATDLQRLDVGMQRALLRLGALVRVMRLLETRDRMELPAVLACFAPMQGIGEGSLYRTLFMSTEFLRLYPAFQPDAAGRPVPGVAVTLASQSEALRAASGLTGDDWPAVVRAPAFAPNGLLANALTAAELQELAGHVPSAAEAEYLARFLRTETVSAVFRRAWLARALRISPRELDLLARATGLDPFADLGVVVAATPPNSAEAFMRLVVELRACGLAPAEALLAFFNEDLLAASAASEATAHGLASTLRSDLTDVDLALAVTDDPESALAQALLASVYDATVADRYLALINRRALVDVGYAAAGGALPAAVLQASDGGLGYDDFTQRLSYSKGVMPQVVRDALISPALGQPQIFTDAVQALFAQTRVFLLQLSPAALLQAHDAFQASAAAEPAKRRQLLADLTTALKPLRKRRAAIDRLTATLRLVGDWPATVLADASALPANRDGAQPGLTDLLAIEQRGVVGEFFFGALGAAPDVADAPAGTLDYRAAGPRSLPANGANPGQPIAGRWRGFLRVPIPGTFNVFIETDVDAAEPALWIEGTSVTLQVVRAGLWRAASQSFDARRLVAFRLEATDLTAHASLMLQTASTPRAVVSADELFAFDAMQDLISTLGRLQRAELLRTKLGLNEPELLHLLRMPELRITINAVPWAWLGVIPIASAATLAVAARLGQVMRSLLTYLRVRRDLGAQPEELLAMLADPVATLRDPSGAFMRRAPWDTTTVDSVLTRLNHVANGQPDRAALRLVANLARVHDVLLPVAALKAPYSLLAASATNSPTDADVRALYSALRSRYGAADWATLMKPINDRVRSRRRDALVASVLHALRTDPDPVRRTVDTADRLYEYLLLDPQMHPRVETSRIRQALASVQQYIQRCVEIPGSEPNDIHVPQAMREQWPWMKRYRVWEANRKVFLYPENWMEPELRDDQSAIFRETMGELLQGDITEERAAEAMIGYLRKLEQLAQLEPAAIHVDTRDTGSTTDDVLHVIARSSGANRKYHYRRRDPGGWMPWQAVKLDIEDNPVLPLRWKNRLFLFWVKIIQEASPAETPTFATTQSVANQSASSIPAGAPTHTVKAILCWSEHVGGKWTDARTSSPSNAALVGTGFTAMGGDKPFIRGDYRLFASIKEDQLDIFLVPERGWDRCWFRLFNSFAEPDVLSGGVTPSFLRRRLLHTIHPTTFAPTYFQVAVPLSTITHPLLRRADKQPGASCGPLHERDALKDYSGPLGASWQDSAPFFYWDSRYTFFISPSMSSKSAFPWAWIGPGIGTTITGAHLQVMDLADGQHTLRALPASAQIVLDGLSIDAGGVVNMLGRS